jgi:hypothetical protein
MFSPTSISRYLLPPVTNVLKIQFLETSISFLPSGTYNQDILTSFLPPLHRLQLGLGEKDKTNFGSQDASGRSEIGFLGNTKKISSSEM